MQQELERRRARQHNASKHHKPSLPETLAVTMRFHSAALSAIAPAICPARAGRDLAVSIAARAKLLDEQRTNNAHRKHVVNVPMACEKLV